MRALPRLSLGVSMAFHPWMLWPHPSVSTQAAWPKEGSLGAQRLQPGLDRGWLPWRKQAERRGPKPSDSVVLWPGLCTPHGEGGRGGLLRSWILRRWRATAQQSGEKQGAHLAAPSPPHSQVTAQGLIWGVGGSQAPSRPSHGPFSNRGMARPSPGPDVGPLVAWKPGKGPADAGHWGRGSDHPRF